MRRRVAAAVLTATLAAGLTLLVAPGASASGKVTMLAASLRGAKEVPGPGDPDGRGRAFVRLAGGKACFVLEWTKINAPIAAHIHVGPVGVAGPVVVPLAPPTNGSASACAEVDRELALAILKRPADYYVNVHNADFPAGAVRGQLSK